MTQVLPIPCRGDALTRRVRPRHIRARGNTLLAQFADVPVLPVDHVPEFDRVIRPEIYSVKRIRMKKLLVRPQHRLAQRTGVLDPERPDDQLAQPSLAAE